MALHFPRAEFESRLKRTRAALRARGLDGMLCFAPESQFWLTGYDTFGYCFFQCLVVGADDTLALITRAPDLRQAQITSIVDDITVWVDADGHNPARDLRTLLRDKGFEGKRLGIEIDTHGLTHMNGKRVDSALEGFCTLQDASAVISELRLVKSACEIEHVRRAAKLADDAWDAGLAITRAGADEGAILAAMQGAVFTGGGDYPGNEFIIGSGQNALLCRYAAGRRKLDANDQLTLEWAGVYRHYHAAMMRTVIIGAPTKRHHELFKASKAALEACETALKPGATMGDVYAAHAKVYDDAGLSEHRMNACGYALGARFSPSWMEHQMFYRDNPVVIEPGMVFFLHMICFDSDTNTAMTLGRTSLVTGEGAEVLSRVPVEMTIR